MNDPGTSPDWQDRGFSLRDIKRYIHFHIENLPRGTLVFRENAVDDPQPATELQPTDIEAAPVDEVRQFFERNASIPGIVTLPSGVQYRVVRQGDGKSPGLNDWVVVDYLGMTPDGTIFDNTYDSGQRAIFGMDGLLPGWQEPLLRMQEGSEFEVYVPPAIANIGGIPSNKKLAGDPGIYLIELRQVVEVGGGE